MKIILPDIKTLTNGDLDLSIFEKFGEVITYPLSKTEDLEERLSEADVILCNKTLLNHETLKKAEQLKYIGLFATGYNNVELEYTNSRNITVCNAGSYSTESVAQHTFALILNYFDKINEYSAYCKNGEWKKCETFSCFKYNMFELAEKKIGIIGFGSIGRRVAEIAMAFHMKVLVYSRNMKKTEGIINDCYDSEIERGEICAVNMDELLSNADIITIHCPLNYESEKMVNKEFLGKMKKNAYLVNTSRGGVINEDDLYDALTNDIIAGAALDVMQVEPMSFECRLMNAKNITITPHVAWAPFETRQRLLDIVVDNLQSYLDGNPKNVIK